MALSDIAGVFSRYLIVGFFLPAFFVIVAASLLVTDGLLPREYRELGDGTKIVVLGGAGLLIALLLSGLHLSLLRVLEGYPLDRRQQRWYVRWPYALAIRRARKQFAALASDMQLPRGDPRRRRAAQRLARYYPPRRWDLLPTRFGNAVRSFERHPRSRWGLDGVVIWPRIELLLNEQQKETHTGAQTDVAFFVNFVVLLLAADVALAVDLVLNTSREAYKFALLLVPVGLAWALYRAAVEAAVRWGQVVRATFDLYRLPLYRGLGVKVPTGPAEEQVIAEFVNRCLWYGEPIPEAARSSSEGGKE